MRSLLQPEFLCLLPVRRRAGGQLAQGSEEAGGARIIQGVELDGGGELRGLGPEADLQHVLVTDRH